MLIFTESTTSRQEQHDHLQGSTQLSASAQPARSILQAASVELPDFPGIRLNYFDRLDLANLIEARVDRHKPRVVYVHHTDDLNVGYHRSHEAVVTACRRTPGHPVQRRLSFEVSSSTEWQPTDLASAFLEPNWVKDISNQRQREREALETHASEMRPWNHVRSKSR